MNEVTNRRLEALVMHSHDLQNKYVYYILAVTAACIGFCVNYTKDLILSNSDFLLALGITAWGLSFYFGISQIQNHEVGVKLNIQQLNGDASKHLQDLQWDAQQKGRRYRKGQNLLLLLGALFFIAWRIYMQCI